MVTFSKTFDNASIFTKQDETGKWSAWVEGIGIAMTTQGHDSEGRAQGALIEDLRRYSEKLQAFIRYPKLNGK